NSSGVFASRSCIEESSRPPSTKWVWLSINPGTMICSFWSSVVTVSFPRYGSISEAVPKARMLSPFMAMASAQGFWESAVQIVPYRMRSAEVVSPQPKKPNKEIKAAAKVIFLYFFIIRVFGSSRGQHLVLVGWKAWESKTMNPLTKDNNQIYMLKLYPYNSRSFK